MTSVEILMGSCQYTPKKCHTFITNLVRKQRRGAFNLIIYHSLRGQELTEVNSGVLKVE